MKTLLRSITAGTLISVPARRAAVWLDNAFYGVASNVQLQFALTADLVGLDADFGNYFDLYRIAVDYAVEEGGAIAIDCRAMMAERAGE